MNHTDAESVNHTPEQEAGWRKKCARACQGVKFTGDPKGSVRRLVEAVFLEVPRPSDELRAAMAAFTLEEKHP